MDLATVGVTPERTSDPAKALRLVQRDGAAILTRAGLSEADARAVGFSIFNRTPRGAVGVKVSDAGDRGQRPSGSSNATRSQCHTSGYSYGQHYPDAVVLLCQWQSEVGGASILVDGYKLFELMIDDPEYAPLAARLATTPVDQTDPGMQPLIRPIVSTTDRGRRMLVTANVEHIRPCLDSSNPVADLAMIERWYDLLDAAAERVEHPKLRNGEALIIDNYRVLHGREPYEDQRRTLWRLWLWTEDSAYGAPSVPLHSDNRHTAA
ncbi:MAG: TauD/TfdA family dioxygenase [Acidimicrobiales bacterium]